MGPELLNRYTAPLGPIVATIAPIQYWYLYTRPNTISLSGGIDIFNMEEFERCPFLVELISLIWKNLHKIAIVNMEEFEQYPFPVELIS